MYKRQGLYNGLELSLPAMALVLLYWASLLAMQLTSFRYAQEQREIGFFRKGNRFTAAYTMRTTMAERCGMIVAGLMRVALFTCQNNVPNEMPATTNIAIR